MRRESVRKAVAPVLQHGRAGVPMEVMGLMLGDFIDDYTVRGETEKMAWLVAVWLIKCSAVVDVFAMPQSGTGVSVEVLASFAVICVHC